jgi:hypothetical protein
MQRKRTLRKSGLSNDAIELLEDQQEVTSNKNLYETEFLERAIVKIGYLLALGFGEAGAGIIG